MCESRKELFFLFKYWKLFYAAHIKEKLKIFNY